MHGLLLALRLATCPYDSTLAHAAQIVQLPAVMIQSIARVESGCNPRAVSSTGALGLLQVLPSWLRSNLNAKCGSDLRDPTVNSCFGTRILRHYLYRCHGNWPCALRRYSGGGYIGYERRVYLTLYRLSHRPTPFVTLAVAFPVAP